MSAIELIILVLSTFRLTVMISQESGPGWIFRKFRGKVKKEAPKSSHLDEGVECPWCVSVWMATLVLLLHDCPWYHDILECVLIGLALSGATILLVRLIK